MKQLKEIQKLFNSQIISPNQFIDLLKTIIHTNHKAFTNVLDEFNGIRQAEIAFKNTSLLDMFGHPSANPLVLEIDFSNGKEKDMVLLGKGILYDSGGYNIKTRGMEEMYGDKFGALTALAIGQALKLPVKVFFAVNLINDYSILPGTILKSKKGKKVRIVDTDAEGRIGLAHLIELSGSYKKLVTFATLTGASHYNVGDGHAEVFDDAHDIQGDLGVIGLGHTFEDYKKGLYTNKILDNYNKSHNTAGAAKAYFFLKEFLTKNQTLTHFDIAGLMSNQEKDYTYGIEDMIRIIDAVRRVK